MKLRLLPVVLLFAFVPAAWAQDAANAAYLEIGGSGIAPTINYERRLAPQWFGRIGFSFVASESEGDSDTSLVFPLTLSWINRPASSHHLELGGGITYLTGEQQDLWDFGDDEEPLSNLVVTGLAGYRYQKPAGGFQFRAVVTPAYVDGELFPWAGISFGYAW